MSLEVFRVPAFKDNYLWIIRSGGQTAAIDPGDANAVAALIQDSGWDLDYIWNTHHHWDHTDGNLALKKKFHCKIIGPKPDKKRIPGIDEEVDEGDTVTLGDATAKVYFTPGHTRGHIVFHFEQEKKAFVGDTLFAMGCGRLFEGTPEQMWQSLQKLRQWPEDTMIYCAHEYTTTNGNFALSFDQENAALKERMTRVNQLRSEDKPTIPFPLSEDLTTNPFLRADKPELKKALGMPNASDVAVFTRIRTMRNHI